MQNILEKNQSLQVEHEQQKLEIIHMLRYIQLYITRRAQPCQNGSNRCNLCLEEKIAIPQANPTKIVSKYRHKAKYKPRYDQFNITTFNANRLITVT